jgi:hypothetical protein
MTIGTKNKPSKPDNIKQESIEEVLNGKNPG